MAHKQIKNKEAILWKNGVEKMKVFFGPEHEKRWLFVTPIKYAIRCRV